MNLTIIALQISSFSRSQILTKSFSKEYADISILHSSFSKCFNSAILTLSKFSSIKIDHSSFIKILESPLILAQGNYKTGFFLDHSLESQRLPLLISPANITNTIFMHCISSYEGGAIFALCDLSLNQCLFQYNTSPFRGGNIYSQGSLNIMHVTFNSGFTPIASGIFHHIQSHSNISLLFTSFISLESINSTCIYQESKSNFNFDSGNISTCSADIQNAGLTISYSKFEVKRSIFTELSASIDTTFLIISPPQKTSVLIDSSSFWLLRSTQIETSTFLTISGTTTPCRVHNTVFQSAVFGSGIFFSRETPLFISNCCSTDSKEKLFGNFMSCNLLRLDNFSSFGNVCDNIFNGWEIGYRPSQKSQISKQTIIVIIILILFSTSSFVLGTFFALLMSHKFRTFFQYN